jgi:flagellin
MSSLLTNTSAMVALQTLKTVNKNLAKTQDMISTGQKIANARDNAALWGISATMRTDVSGFKAISESLSLGSATLSVGRDAAETITDLLDQLKGKVVAAQEENVDRTKIQRDVGELVKQIESVSNGAQFNGLNLIKGQDTIRILGSLNRADDNTVSASHIVFEKYDLSQDDATLDATTPLIPDASFDGDTAVTVAADQTMTLDVGTGASANDVTITLNFSDDSGTLTESFDISLTGARTSAQVAGDIYATLNTEENVAKLAKLGIALPATAPAGTTIAFTTKLGGAVAAVAAGGNFSNGIAGVTQTTTSAETVTVAAAFTPTPGNAFQVTLGAGETAQNFVYVAMDDDTYADVAAGLKAKIDEAKLTGVTTYYAAPADAATDAELIIHYDGTGDFGDTTMAIDAVGREGGNERGGLADLKTFDVTTATGAKDALDKIDPLIQRAINAAASFGSAQGRIQTQSEFVSRIMDSLTSGIGALVDADMEEASAKLQALQVQQQLGIQALTIANQQPQNILALFQG